MDGRVTRGTLQKIRDGVITEGPVFLKVSQLQPLGKKHKGLYSDGSDSMEAVFASAVSSLIESGQLTNDCVVKLVSFTCNLVNESHKLISTECEVDAAPDSSTAQQAPIKEESESQPAGSPCKENMPSNTKVETQASSSPMGNKRLKVEGTGSSTPHAAKRDPEAMKTPAHPRVASLASSSRTPQPSPSEQPTPAPAGPPMDSPGLSIGSARKAVQPIAALNPYNMSWTIKARLVKKGPKRSFTKGGTQSTSVFSIELVDEQGTQIEASVWRDLADRYYDLLEEGKVYYVAKGKVKPANKAYSSVRNDYQLHLDSGSEIEECPDQDTSKMQAKLSIVPIDQLSLFIGKKAGIDLMGVVTDVGQLGSVKRKSDNSELSRRDITLLDTSQKTVTMTLWGETAQDKGALLEAQDCPVITVTACRVSDYNGVSVSAGQRSDIQINPGAPEAQALRQWYDFEGRTAPTQHAGEGLANARGSSGGGGSQERVTFQQLTKSPAEMPSPDAKPEYHNATCTVANIDPQQSMYYQACPDNNRKVVEQNGQWYCEYHGKTYPSMVRRYVTTLQCTDHTAELTLNAFNEQVEGLLGMSADDLAMLKEGNPEKQRQYQALLKKVQWQDFVVRIQTRTREYEGQLRMRYTVQSMKPVEYVAESKRMIEALAKLHVKVEAG
ncbi:hypothetical protein ABBQ32_005523 [Trebouxia sp. C0010 RCD-2024]